VKAGWKGLNGGRPAVRHLADPSSGAPGPSWYCPVK
jgi:hypothetical protein